MKDCFLVTVHSDGRIIAEDVFLDVESALDWGELVRRKFSISTKVEYNIEVFEMRKQHDN